MFYYLLLLVQWLLPSRIFKIYGKPCQMVLPGWPALHLHFPNALIWKYTSPISYSLQELTQNE